MNGWHLSDLIPGLYTALLALLLGRALRRWFDPLPGRVAAVFGIVLLALLGPVLVGGKILLPVEILTRTPPWRTLRPARPALANRLQLDLVSQITPALALTRREVKAGEWPLWNPLAGTGMPLLADPQSQPFQPLVVLAWPLSLPAAAGVMAALRVLAALVFLFLFLRRQGLGELPALAGSLAYGLGGFLLLWLGWPIANSAALLSLLLYALALTADRGERRDFLLLGLAVGSVLLAGQPETAVNDLLLAAVYALARLAERARVHRERLRLLAAWTLAGLLACGAVAPLLLPAAYYLPQTHRNTRIERRNQKLRRENPLDGWRTAPELRVRFTRIAQRLLPIAAPNAYGNNRFGPYWGDDNINEDAAAFAGGAALLAALLTLGPLFGWNRRQRQERLFLGIAAVCLVVIARPPGMIQLVAALPLLGKSATFQHRLVLPLLLATAYLAACTLERWRREGVRRGPLAVAAAALLAVVAWAYLKAGVPKDPTALADLRHQWLAGQLAALAAAAVLLGWRRPGRAPGAVQKLLLLTLIAGELLWIHLPANPGMPRRFYWPTTPAVTFLEHHLKEDDGFRLIALGASFQPNGAALYGLSDGRYTNPLQPWNAAVVLRPLVDSPDQVNDLYYPLEHPLYGFLGARYGMVPEGVALPPPWRLAFVDRSAWVYERPAPQPRYFLPPEADRLPGYPWPRWMANRQEYASAVILRGRSGVPEVWKPSQPAASKLEIESLGAAHVRLRAALAEPRLLASSHYQDGGWKLLVDRRPHPTVVADGPFLAAWLPAGEHRLDFVYRPRTFLPACLLAALALVGGALWWVPRPKPASERTLKPIPKFESEDQEREFWATHDSTDYVDWSHSRPGSFSRLSPVG
jgi:hypothetical protein